jgi:anti-sigma regulatory factor (Ser/Thr protein kinase)
MKQQVVWCVERRFPQERSSVREARGFVVHALIQHDLSHLVDDIELVVSELVTNVVVHAETPVRVVVEELPFCVKLSVYDERADRPVPRLSQRLDSGDGGRGLGIIDACSAAWGVETGHGFGKCVWALFAVPPKSSWIEQEDWQAPIRSDPYTESVNHRVSAPFAAR